MIFSTSKDGRVVMVLQVYTMTPVFVYQPEHERQFEAGHEAGSWYFRPHDYYGMRPKSCPYASQEAAVEAGNVSLGEVCAAR